MLLGKSKVIDIIENLIKRGGTNLEKAVNEIINIYTAEKLSDEVIQDLAFMVRDCVDTNGSGLHSKAECIIDYIQLKAPSTITSTNISPIILCKNEKQITREMISRVAYIEKQKNKRRQWEEEINSSINNLKTELDYKGNPLENLNNYYRPKLYIPENFYNIPEIKKYDTRSFTHSGRFITVSPRDQYFFESQSFLPTDGCDRGYSGKIVESLITTEGLLIAKALQGEKEGYIKNQLQSNLYYKEHEMIASLLYAINSEYMHPDYKEIPTQNHHNSYFNFIHFLQRNFSTYNKFILMSPLLREQLMLESLIHRNSVVYDSGTFYGDNFLVSQYIPKNVCYALLNLEPDTIEIFKEEEYYRNYNVGCDFGNKQELGLITKYRIFVKPKHFRVIRFIYGDEEE